MTDYHDEVWRRVSREIFHAQGGSGESPLQPVQKPLSDLGLDSLKLIEIVYQLETFYQLDVDEERLAELDKVGDLIELFVCAQPANTNTNTRGQQHDADAH